MKKLNHLADIFENYDTFIIDLWGVMHNGILLNNKAMQATNKLLEESKKIDVLVSVSRFSKNFLLSESFLGTKP